MPVETGEPGEPPCGNIRPIEGEGRGETVIADCETIDQRSLMKQERGFRCYVLASIGIGVGLVLTSPNSVKAGKSNATDCETPGESGNTYHQQAPGGGSLTPEEMRAAKPMPLPSYSGPPIQEQRTPPSFAEPPGASSPGFGGPARASTPGDDPVSQK